MRIVTVRDIDSTLESLRSETNKEVKNLVLTIISDVRKRRDKALKTYEKKFNKITLRSLKVSAPEIKLAYTKVSEDQIRAIKLVKNRLEKSEIAVKNQLRNISISNDGIRIRKTFSPIDSVGCYIPGGKARYPSTVVMSVVPAKVAGVKKIVAVSSAYQEGSIDPLTLVSADICGVDEFYKISGAQAIAALAYGTKSIPKVDKIVGPGGVFVSLAKSLLADVVSIDMMAGPTELVIIADSSAYPKLVALDIISQAEHSSDTMCCLITNSSKIQDEVLRSLEQKVRTIRRSEIVKESLEKNGFMVMCKTEQQMIESANKLAPEHLEIMTKNPQ